MESPTEVGGRAQHSLLVLLIVMIHSKQSFSASTVLFLLVSLATGCGSDDTNPNGDAPTSGGTSQVTGGASAQSGAATSGGSSSTGGSLPLAGGTVGTGGGATGGAAPTGGATSGGSASTGGSVAGGTSSTGGRATGGASGGATTSPSGGKASGGSSTTGGSPRGGAAATGGNAGGGTTSGGSSTTGGTPAGGTPAMGGSTTGGATPSGGASSGGSSSTGGGATGGAAGASTTTPGTCSGHGDAVFSLVGWGTGTSGGKGGSRVEVSTGTALQAALKAQQKATTPLTIVVTGTITPDNSTEADGTPLSKIDVKDLSNVSIIGAGAGAEFNGIGIKLMRTSNVILRNLKVHHVLIGDKDAISIEGPVDHVWVDHCELYNTYQGVDKDYYDALLDAKDDSQYLTYSWNYLHDSWKMSLVGYTESDTFDRKLTMHHNYIENVNSRTPLIRGSNAHVFNNYYQDVIDTGINSRVGACVQIEQNYFSNVKNPWVSAFSGATGLGGAEVICNLLTDGTVFAFNAASEIFEVEQCTLDVPYDYSAVLNAVEQVPAVVSANAGVGKLSDPESF